MPGTFFSQPRLHNNFWIHSVRLKTRQKNMTQVGFEPETFDMGTLGSYQLDYERLDLIYLVGQLFDPPPKYEMYSKRTAMNTLGVHPARA